MQECLQVSWDTGVGRCVGHRPLTMTSRPAARGGGAAAADRAAPRGRRPELCALHTTRTREVSGYSHSLSRPPELCCCRCMKLNTKQEQRNAERKEKGQKASGRRQTPTSTANLDALLPQTASSSLGPADKGSKRSEMGKYRGGGVSGFTETE